MNINGFSHPQNVNESMSFWLIPNTWPMQNNRFRDRKLSNKDQLLYYFNNIDGLMNI